MKKEVEALQKIESEKRKVINQVKDRLKTKRGNTHDWDYVSVHHGWTFWHRCKLCGKYKEKDRELTKKDMTEECPFFGEHFIPYIENLKEYLE